MRRGATIALIVVLGCKPEPEPAAPDPNPEPAPAVNFDALRASDDRALLTSLVGPVTLDGWEIRSAHDLGTTRMVLLDRPDQPQTVSVIDMAPPEDLTPDQLRAALAGGVPDPLQVLGYDTVEVVEHDGDWARIVWSRDGDAGEGTVRWTPCGDRWIFVGEEITGGTWTRGATAGLLESFRICVR